MNRNPDDWISNLHNHRRAGERELELLDVIKKGKKKHKKSRGEKWDVRPPPLLSVSAR